MAQYCTFLLGDFLFGIEVLQVQEVIRAQQLTRVPLANPVVSGLINLRGQIVTALDLRRRLGLPPREDDVPPMNVVVHTADGGVSLLVDEIGDVLQVEASSYQATPLAVQGLDASLIRGVHKLPGQLLLLLDVDRAVSAAQAHG